MDVILLERVEKLGGMGDIVAVKNGYARNFLLPQKKALRATEENKARFEREREALEKLNGDRRDAAQSASTRLDGESIILIRQASDMLQLYGSVNARDIAEAMADLGSEIKRQQVRLDHPIKSLGIHDVQVALHPEVIVTVKVNVARSPEEAEIQAAGGSILAPGETEEEEDDALAQDVFEEGVEAPEPVEDEGPEPDVPQEAQDAVPEAAEASEGDSEEGAEEGSDERPSAAESA